MEALEERKESIVPSTKSSLEAALIPQTNNQTSPYVFNDRNKWDVMNKLRVKFKGRWDGAGYFINIQYKNEVEEFCAQYNLVCVMHPIPENIDSLPYYDPIDLSEQQLENICTEIEVLLHNTEIQFYDIDDLQNKHIKSQISKTKNGKKVLDLLAQYHVLQKKITYFESQKLVKNATEILQPLTHDSLTKSGDDLLRKESYAFLFESYTSEAVQLDLKKTPVGLETGYSELDKLVRIPSQAITLIAGRPSHGKTTFMMNVFVNMILKYPDEHFYFFTREETKQKIALKIINIISGTILYEERQNLLQLESYMRSSKNNNAFIEEGKAKYDDLVNSGRLRIIEISDDAQELSNKISYINSRVPLGGVFIDYIQKIKNSQRFGTRQLELADTSNIFLKTAMSCSIPIVLGVQLGRDKDSKNKLKLENLRECGDLEQDANLVIGIFNQSMENEIDETKKVYKRIVDLDITILKNRDSVANETIQLTFDRPLLKIKDKEG